MRESTCIHLVDRLLMGGLSRCHPTYLSTEAHAALARKGAFEGLKIHTDAVGDVLTGFAEGSLDCAVVRLVSLGSPSSSTSFAVPHPLLFSRVTWRRRLLMPRCLDYGFHGLAVSSPFSFYHFHYLP